MNKKELVEKTAEKTGTTQKISNEILTAALEIVVEAVASGDKVTLVGFGTFESRDRKEREGRNPKTGDSVTIPAHKTPAFSAGKTFKEQVDSGQF